jgi:hypothetical protein
VVTRIALAQVLFAVAAILALLAAWRNDSQLLALAVSFTASGLLVLASA